MERLKRKAVTPEPTKEREHRETTLIKVRAITGSLRYQEFKEKRFDTPARKYYFGAAPVAYVELRAPGSCIGGQYINLQMRSISGNGGMWFATVEEMEEFIVNELLRKPNV